MQPADAFQLPNVVGVINNSKKDNLVNEVISWNLTNNNKPFNHNNVINTIIPGTSSNSLSKAFGTGKKTRSFIKIQDGCNNSCTFCVTTLARGKSTSIAAATIINEIQQTLLNGANEIVLTGVNLGSWGKENHQELSGLIRMILENTDVKRLRLSSLEPWDLDSNFFSLWQDNRICPHLHLPLQSGCETTLKRMRRKTSPNIFRELVSSARSVVPEIAITTDVIVGFPGETENEFLESMQFVKDMNFAGGHVFRYSPRQGTLAASFDNQIEKNQKKERASIAQNIFQNSSKEYRQSFINREIPVLWEASSKRVGDNWKIEGLTGNYIKVTTISSELRWNTISHVKLTELTDEGMSGIIV